MNDNKENLSEQAQTAENDANRATNSDQRQECCFELQELKNRCLYLTAEFDNYKKRIEKEKLRWLEDGQDIILTAVLPIVDDFDRAFDKLKEQSLPQEVFAHFEGISLIAKELDKFLTNFQVEEVKYDKFDPEIHEALIQVQSDKQQHGEIVDILEKGYIRKGKLLRAAKVSVAK